MKERNRGGRSERRAWLCCPPGPMASSPVSAACPLQKAIAVAEGIPQLVLLAVSALSFRASRKESVTSLLFLAAPAWHRLHPKVFSLSPALSKNPSAPRPGSSSLEKGLSGMLRRAGPLLCVCDLGHGEKGLG